MSHPLEYRIATLRRRVRRLVTLHGLSWIIAAVLSTVIVLGLVDYQLRFQDRGIRIICSLLVFGALGWTCYRFLYLPLCFRLRDVDLALRLQRRFPDLEDRLVSTVEFLRQPEDEPLAGSATLRRAVITQTTAETDRLDFSEVLDTRPPWRAAMVGASIFLVAMILAVADWTSSRAAVARLVNPLGSTTFPQKTHLAFKPQLRRVGRGQPFEVEVIDRFGAALPAEVRMFWRFEGPDGNVTEETEVLRRIDSRITARRESVLRPFSYRAEGGDDALMDWIDVEVVEPPTLARLAIRLVPPAYTGLPAETSPRDIRALVGTRVKISAVADRPLKFARLRLDDGREVDAGPSAAQHRDVAAEFVVDEDSQAWQLQLTDPDGLSGGADAGGEIRPVADAAPTVSIEQPAANVFVTSGGVVPLRVVAKDDLAVRDVALVFGPADPEKTDEPAPPESILPLFSGSQPIGPQRAGGLAGGPESSDRRVVEHRWELAELGLSPGTQLAFHAVATDYFPKTGRSEPRRLFVITPEELQDRIANREGLIVAELARVLKMQRGSRGQVASLQIRLDQVGRLEEADVDRLLPAELSQRQVHRGLTSRSEGVPVHVLALLADLENNQLDAADVRRRMQALLDEIDRLDREHLTLIGRELTAAIKSARVALGQQPTPPGDRRVAESLASAGAHQDQVIAALEQLLDQLARWDDYRRFHREISQVLRDQQELSQRTAEVGRRTLTKDLKDLRPQELADLKVLASRQLELGRQLDRIQQAMQRTSSQLQQSDPLAAQTVADALDEARRRAISGQMRSAGGQVDRNQIGQATRGQAQIARDLQEVLDILANRRQHELVRLIEKLKEAEEDLADVQRRQTEVQNEMQRAAAEPDDAQNRRRLEQLARKQEQLQRETEQMARRLQRLLAEQAARTTGQAAGQMGRAGQCAAGGNCQGAAQHAAEAKKNLEQARQQLAQRRQQAEAELAGERLARLEDTLKQLRTRQQNVLDETLRYDGLPRLSRAQAAGLRDLARQQELLQSETVRMADQLIRSGAFHLALSGAARDMGRAAELLGQRQTGPPTQEAEQHALGRLDLLLEALKPEPPEPEQENNGGNGAGGAGGAGGAKGQGGAAEAAQALAELKLLRLLQEEINLRTRQLHEAVAAAENVTPEQQRRYAELSREQGQLADLVLQLLQVQPQAPEEDLEGLPDLREDPEPEEQPPLLPPEEELP